MQWLKVGAVIFSAVLITALGIDAADTLSGSRSTLLGQVISNDGEHSCPSGMTPVPMATSFTCADIYEVSASGACTHASPANELQTQDNMNNTSCTAASVEGADAWRFITREQAQTACVRAGKRLPQSSELYLVSVGTPDDKDACNTKSTGALKTGVKETCVSAVGAHDVIGNLWEWTSDDVIDGMYQGRNIPESGYVAQVDAQGVAVLTTEKPSALFYNDYFWSSNVGAFAMLRGGFYGSGSDAGVYAVHAQTLPTAAGTAIGFRCIK